MVLQISQAQARQLLTCYHFTPTDLPGVFERLSTVQYDPLSPAGRNPDLVLQARVPGYRVDDWQNLAYVQRQIYDSWDKQACLVPIDDWPQRALIREHFRPYHDSEILQQEITAVAAILEMLDKRGPLSSLEFENKATADKNSWYGATQARRILRSLWACGEVVTHHRRSGRHYYDRAERVIPADHFVQAPLVDRDAYHRWIVARRFQATGLLRPVAEAAIWASCGTAVERKVAMAELVEAGTITAIQIGPEKGVYYAWTEALKWLDLPLPEPRMIFLGPLDSLLWDRKGVRQIFGFDYIWEVYKPEQQRKWGYYVLPVFYGDRFVARCDTRLEKGTWNIVRWWWENDIQPDATLLSALRAACEQFMVYMSASGIQASEQVDDNVRQVVQSLARL